MSKEELEKDYYVDRPIEPYSDDDNPNDWANIAHYAEENIEKAFKRIEDLEKENTELKAFRQDYVKLTEDNVVMTRQRAEIAMQLTKAKDLLLRFIDLKNKPCAVGHSVNMLLYDNICAEAEQFLKDSEVEK
jgi:hypothetical protein